MRTESEQNILSHPGIERVLCLLILFIFGISTLVWAQQSGSTTRSIRSAEGASATQVPETGVPDAPPTNSGDTTLPVTPGDPVTTGAHDGNREGQGGNPSEDLENNEVTPPDSDTPPTPPTRPVTPPAPPGTPPGIPPVPETPSDQITEDPTLGPPPISMVQLSGELVNQSHQPSAQKIFEKIERFKKIPAEDTAQIIWAANDLAALLRINPNKLYLLKECERYGGPKCTEANNEIWKKYIEGGTVEEPAITDQEILHNCWNCLFGKLTLDSTKHQEPLKKAMLEWYESNKEICDGKKDPSEPPKEKTDEGGEEEEGEKEVIPPQSQIVPDPKNISCPPDPKSKDDIPPLPETKPDQTSPNDRKGKDDKDIEHKDDGNKDDVPFDDKNGDGEGNEDPNLTPDGEGQGQDQGPGQGGGSGGGGDKRGGGGSPSGSGGGGGGKKSEPIPMPEVPKPEPMGAFQLPPMIPEPPISAGLMTAMFGRGNDGEDAERREARLGEMLKSMAEMNKTALSSMLQFFNQLQSNVNRDRHSRLGLRNSGPLSNRVGGARLTPNSRYQKFRMRADAMAGKVSNLKGNPGTVSYGPRSRSTPKTNSNVLTDSPRSPSSITPLTTTPADGFRTRGRLLRPKFVNPVRKQAQRSR